MLIFTITSLCIEAIRLVEKIVSDKTSFLKNEFNL